MKRERILGKDRFGTFETVVMKNRKGVLAPFKFYGQLLPCTICGKKVFRVRTRIEKRNYCSIKCSALGRRGTGSGKKWKGGKYISYSGYLMILNEKYSGAKGDRRYVAEHRYVMEQKIGRKLKSNEVVHHLNGDKLDNRIENLALCGFVNHFDYIKMFQERIRFLENKYEHRTA